jgi:isoleucyl-tRNA synthetase
MPEEFNLPKTEEKILKLWEQNQIFQKTLEQRKGKKAFVFYEGPPYANGKPGIHHVLARVVKDVILRYKTMRGFYVPRKGGWDTHGLPVEIAAEKALGLKSKKDIEKFGIQLFNQKAKEAVWLYKDEWENMTRRIGYWLDLKNAYITYEPEYIETLWWTLSEIAKKKLLYKGHKVVPWCVRCGTALSSHELAMGYKEVIDQSVYVKFRLARGQKIGGARIDGDTFIVSWTTTPWTLPGNVALAVGVDIEYAIVKKMVNGKIERLIVAKDLVQKIGSPSDIRDTFKGKDLIGLSYEPLFDIKGSVGPTSYKIYAAKFVTTTDGTGVVHTAVMYGEDDYQLGVAVGLPQKHTVSEEGNFLNIVPGLGGLRVKTKETDEKIFAHLTAKGNLLKFESYTHEYPHCWRCDTPVLYYARHSWFIAMSKLRSRLLAANKTINWSPAHLQNGRFGEWLREAKDWNLSRERYWGTPLPIWECKKCAHYEVIGGLDELDQKLGGARNNYWVMRHGEAESNIFDLIDDGTKTFHLTPRGRAQAKVSAQKLKKELNDARKKIDVIFSSDVTRTKETQEIIAGVLGVEKVIFDKRLREIHLGELEGCHDKRYKILFPTYEDRFGKKPEGGETLRDLRARIWEFFAETEKKYRGKNIIIVSHEYPIWMLLHVVCGWSEKRAIEEKIKRSAVRNGDFIGLAEFERFTVKKIPRNDTGEVDLHRPFADGLAFPCPKCVQARSTGSGQTFGLMQRVKEVADVWYDSGAMPFASVHWPFAQTKNSKSKTQNAPAAYPADYIAEGMDQTRGWFYTLLAVATAMGHEAPYKNVVSLGLINDKFGQKMSKSKGNIVDPWVTIEKFGIDAVRWYFYTSAPLGEPKNFDEMEIGKTYRRMHMLLYNSLVFYKTYARRTQRSTLPASRNILDRWILARLHETVVSASKHLEKYEIREAALMIESLVDDLSRWYIRRSRRRLQKPASEADFGAASGTLGFVLRETIKLIAPFMPFFAESLYGQLSNVPSQLSVHLEDWPKTNSKFKTQNSKPLIRGMAEVRRLASMGLAKRAEAGIKVRQPLASMRVGAKIEKEFQKILEEEVNIKKIIFDSKLKDSAELDTSITPELREEGMLRELVRTVQDLRQGAKLTPKDKIVLFLALPKELQYAAFGKEKFFKTEVGAEHVEYKRTDKFDAEIITKIENQEAWIGVKKI